jgi:hypothetical protein
LGRLSIELPDANTSGWLFLPKCEQIQHNSYPAVLDDSEDWHLQTNTVRGIYWAGAQQELYSILSESFRSSDQNIINTYSPLCVDADTPAGSSTTNARLRTHYPDDIGRSFGHDKRWPYGSYTFLALRKVYGLKKSLNVFSLMSEYDLLKKQFKVRKDINQWVKEMKTKRFALEEAKLGQNPEYLETINVLVEMSANDAWKEWCQTYASNQAELELESFIKRNLMLTTNHDSLWR